MKTLLLSATALALILSVPAFAADQDHGDRHGHTATPAAAAAPAGGGHAGGGHAGGGHANHAANPLAGGGGTTRGSHHQGHDTGGANIPTTGGTGGTQHHGRSNGAANGAALILPGATGHSGMNQGSGGRHGGNTAATIFGVGGHGYRNASNFGHSRHNSAFDQYRRAVHASHHYHDGTYYRPAGWYEHTWNYGDFLPALFFADRYQIDDYSDFDLADPPDGTVWVRYGNDALLVDDDTGEIIQVVYGIFY